MVGQGRTLLGDRATRSDENSRRACRAASFAISSVSSGDTWLCIFSLRRITTTGQLVQLSGLHTLQNQVPACTDQSLFFESSPRSKGSCQPCTQPHAAHRRHHSRASMPSRRNELSRNKSGSSANPQLFMETGILPCRPETRTKETNPPTFLRSA